MAKKSGKSRTAAANAARRKQGPTKQTDYKNGRPVTAAAKKKASGGGKRQRTNPGGKGGGGKGGKTVSFAGGKAKGEVFYSKTLGKHVTVPGASNVRSASKPKGSGTGQRKAKEAFKQRYKEITGELKEMGISEKQWDKRAITRQAHAAALRASPRAATKKVKAYAKGVAKKELGITSKTGQGHFYKGYRRGIKQDYGI